MRLREIALESTIQTSAEERTTRAIQTKTLPAGESFEYKIGQQVKFWRNHPQKMQWRWIGPATVIDNTKVQHGTLQLRHQHLPFEVRVPQDARPVVPF